MLRPLLFRLAAQTCRSVMFCPQFSRQARVLAASTNKDKTERCSQLHRRNRSCSLEGTYPGYVPSSEQLRLRRWSCEHLSVLSLLVEAASTRACLENCGQNITLRQVCAASLKSSGRSIRFNRSCARKSVEEQFFGPITRVKNGNHLYVPIF